MKQRINSIDMLRGIVMIIMALDHVRDFLYSAANAADVSSPALDPTNLATTTPALFFTRWITHFCAPVFVFLSGTSAFLITKRRTQTESAVFLIKRGLWLILLEVTLISFSWTFDPEHKLIFFQVIWAIGISMVFLGLFVRFFRFEMILAIGLLIVFGHNLFDIFPPGQSFRDSLIGNLSFTALFSYHAISEARGLIIVYTFVPWLGVMCLGYGFGKWYSGLTEINTRSKKMMQAGMLIILFFLVLRATNVYGDPQPWMSQPRGEFFTFLSFFNTTKYPPSLLYLCMTIGPALLFLGLMEKSVISEKNPFVVVGRVPLFYYILHFYLLHLMVVVIFYAKGYGSGDIVSPNNPFNFTPPGIGFGLPGIYLCWLILVSVLYPLCVWYNRYKATHHHWWLSYL